MDSQHDEPRDKLPGGASDASPGSSDQNERSKLSRALNHKNFAISLAIAWTLLMAGFCTWENNETWKHANEKARLDAAISFQKDVLYRLWASGHGGVYVPVTQDTQPNPYLIGIPERDIITPSGRKLTLLNPAYMTRQVHELAAARFGLLSHITSLKPIRPENAPDAWEQQALQKFEAGASEISEVTTESSGKQALRFMRPFLTEQSCLKCHAAQGYKEGDVRGGISVTIPLGEYHALAKHQIAEEMFVYVVIWIIGLCWLFVGFFFLNRHRNAYFSSLEALKTSEAKFSTVFHQSPVLTSLSSLEDGTFIEVNDRVCQVLECRREELIGKRSVDLGIFLPADRQRLLETLRHHGKVSGMEMTFQAKSGRQIKTLANAEVINLNGRRCVLSVLIDITERRRVEAALAQNEAELAAIYEHAPSMMLLVDKDGKVRRHNQAAAQFARMLFGAVATEGPDDLLGCMSSPGVAGESAAGPDASWTLRSDIQDTLNNGATHHRTEVQPRIISEGRTFSPTLLSSTALVKVGDERMVLVCLEDITQQKLDEQRIRDQAALLDVTQDAIIVLDLDGRVTYWTHGAVKLYGWRAEEAMGKAITELFSSTNSASGLGEKLADIRKQGSWQGSLQLHARNGSPIIVLCHGVMMYDSSGNDRSILLSASDITESKRVETQLLRAQRLESIGSLAGGVAHDLNNVFAPIMLSTGTLRTMIRDPHASEIIKLINESVQRGSDIVRKLLLFGRGSDSSAPLEDVSLLNLAEELRHMIQETFPKNIRYSIQLPADLSRPHGDKTHLYQVLLNLCVNARDAMPQGGELTLTASNVELDEPFVSKQSGAKCGPHVLLQVTDTGAGISQEIMDKIFDPFFTTKEIGQGSGLGLSTTLGIVRNHGGFITVKSQPGHGSTFSIYLPASKAAISTAVPLPMINSPQGLGECVLVVDDEVNIQRVARRVLLASGFTVLTASSGERALELLAVKENRIRLVVTDVMMPGIDGFEMVQKLRQGDPQLPVITMSGLHYNRGKFDLMPPPKIGHLFKPFGPDDFLRKVHEFIGGIKPVGSG